MATRKSLVPAKPIEEQGPRELMRMADGGDERACKALFKHMDQQGVTDAAVETLTNIAENTLRTRYQGLVQREACRRKFQQMRDSLGVATATTLEALLIERIVLCWHHLQETEMNYWTQARKGMSLEKATYLQKTLDRAEARYQAAIKSLAVVRRLQLPAVQVNIGEKQINVVQAGGQKGTLGPKELETEGLQP